MDTIRTSISPQTAKLAAYKLWILTLLVAGGFIWSYSPVSIFVAVGFWIVRWLFVGVVRPVSLVWIICGQTVAALMIIRPGYCGRRKSIRNTFQCGTVYWRSTANSFAGWTLDSGYTLTEITVLITIGLITLASYPQWFLHQFERFSAQLPKRL